MNSHRYYDFPFLPDGGETGQLVRSIDWTVHPLGLPETWPEALKIIIGMIYSSQQPMFIFWGKEYYCFYNDSYGQSIRPEKHPRGLGLEATDFWPDIWSEIGPQVNEVFLSGKSTWHENRLVPILRNGSIEDVYWTYGCSPIFSGKGEICGVLAVCTETTAQVQDLNTFKKNEQFLLQSKNELFIAKQELHDFFMQAPVPMVILTGKDHFFTLANPMYEALIGRQAQGRRLDDVFFEDEISEFLPILTEVFSSGVPYSGKDTLFYNRIDKKNVQEVWLNYHYHPFRDELGQIKGILAIVVDVTEHVQAKLIVEETVRDLEEERDVRNRFVAALTHDLRQPLMIASGCAQFLEKRSPTPEQLKKLSMIIRNIDRADGMIRDILDANSVKAGEIVPSKYEPCNLNHILQDATEGLVNMYGERFKIIAPEIIQGVWDRNSIRRMIENLATNAIKYGSNDSPVTFAIMKSFNMVKISVHNLGNPISYDDQRYIFEPYKRTASAKQGSLKGWGIGLMLTRSLAESQRGQLSVVSSEGSGTTFTILLPQDASKEFSNVSNMPNCHL